MTIKIDPTALGATYKIYNTIGEAVLNGLLLENNSIDISALNTNVYMIEIKTKDETFRENLIVD